MSRAEILADLLAELERERYLPVTPAPKGCNGCGPSRPDVTDLYGPVVPPEEAAHNQQVLRDALSEKPVVTPIRERKAG